MEIRAALRPRRLSRRAWATVLSLLLITGAIIGSCRVISSLPLATGPDDYNIADWELRYFPGKWLFLFGTLLEGNPGRTEQDETLRRFFQLNREIANLERQDPDGALLAERREERARVENQVEATLESRVGAVAKDAGLTLPVLGLVWPPVDTEFTESPHTLVTSRRDRIELQGSRLLRLDADLDEIEALEEEAEDGGNTSALAFPTGGVGAYPTIVDYPAGYRDALHLIAHEWTHNYLSFYPLGIRYGRSNDLRTINESVADLVGRELAEAVIARWPLEEATRPAPQPAAPGTQIDVGAELRALREEVDGLLAQGQIEEAEALMEERRQELAAAGYYFRKLNQAYFAFVNLYAGEAGNPAATNPIGPKIDALRARSDSLADFVASVRSVTSLADLDRRLAGEP